MPAAQTSRRDLRVPVLIAVNALRSSYEIGTGEVQKRTTFGKIRSMWILQSSASDEGPWTFRMRPGSVKTLGRAPRADFVVDAALVSRLHCRLTADDDRLEVVDLSSTNGTFVNDRRVERARVADGDRLRVGRIELRIGWES